MPDFWSHRYAAKMTYNALSRQIPWIKTWSQTTLQFYYLGAQGPDCFYYINKTNPLTKEKYKKIGNHLHEEQIASTIKSMLSYAINNPSDQTFAYILGYVSHYFTDVYCHPFICTWGPTSESHKLVELQLDALTIWDFTGKPIHTSDTRRLHPKPRALGKHFAPMWQHVLKETSTRRIPDKQLIHSARNFNLIQWLLIKDVFAKIPFKSTFSQWFDYNLNLLTYPKNMDELYTQYDYGPYKSAFESSIEISKEVISKLIKSYDARHMDDVWLKNTFNKDFIGRPTHD